MKINLVDEIDINDENKADEQTKKEKYIWFWLLLLLLYFIAIKWIMTIIVEYKQGKTEVVIIQDLEKKIYLSLILTKDLLRAYVHNTIKIIILKNTIIHIKDQHLIIFVLQLI